ncbi:nuclear polyadenylated RNA-binding protein 3 [Diaphorina citri]|uniref:Nuclear polyadenylated RNA-binding protein 3 n=1 Tax=Diaphorina citri TaxID=121845 RepID=A0A1S4ETA4_DIACI|nr:nuclear polyadenylated RNA-binding protein 3 [Diaphorina citri]
MVKMELHKVIETSIKHLNNLAPLFTTGLESTGLGIYDDSDTESSASEEEAEAEPSQQLQSAYETEDALRDKLNQRKREFSRVEREIELKIQAQEEHERLVAQKEDSDDSEDDDDDDDDKPGQVHRAQPGTLERLVAQKEDSDDSEDDDDDKPGQVHRAQPGKM